MYFWATVKGKPLKGEYGGPGLNATQVREAIAKADGVDKKDVKLMKIV